VGLAQFAKSSLVATLGFMAAGFALVNGLFWIFRR
jgi:hypothetical protein